MPEASTLHVDLGAVHHNMRVLRRIVGPQVRLCPVVKADAYGLGARRLAKCLHHAGADMFAVYSVEQASEVIASVPDVPVLVLMPVWKLTRIGSAYRAVAAGRVHLSIHGLEHARAVSHIARDFGTPVPVHLEVDTGMTRGGVGLDSAAATLRAIRDDRWLTLAGLYTHFADAESSAHVTTLQMAALTSFIETVERELPPGCIIHAANTAGTLRDRATHARMVRLGLAWAGFGGELLTDGHAIDGAYDLKPALRWRSRVVHLHHVGPGTRVGYGGTWHASRASVIGLVPVGYADGLPSVFGTSHTIHRPVHVRMVNPESGEHADAPIVGAVNMDQITIDLTDLPAEMQRIGTIVEIYSPDPRASNHIPTIAASVGLPPHDLISRISPRVPREYGLESDALRQAGEGVSIARATVSPHVSS